MIVNVLVILTVMTVVAASSSSLLLVGSDDDGGDDDGGVGVMTVVGISDVEIETVAVLLLLLLLLLLPLSSHVLVERDVVGEWEVVGELAVVAIPVASLVEDMGIADVLAVSLQAPVVEAVVISTGLAVEDASSFVEAPLVVSLRDEIVTGPMAELLSV